MTTRSGTPAARRIVAAEWRRSWNRSYFGDLDPDGLRIPDGADGVARELGLPRVLPAPALWAALLRRGRPAKHSPVDPAVAARLVGWLPAGLRVDAKRHLVAGTRLAQEALSLDVLRLDTHWAFPAGLDLPAAASTQLTSTD